MTLSDPAGTLSHVSSRIPSDQSFVPVITGGLLGTYSLGREFHMHSGIRSAFVPTVMNRHLRDTRLGDVFPSGDLTRSELLLEALEEVSTTLAGASRPLLYLPIVDHHVDAGVEFRDDLAGMGFVLPDISAHQLRLAAIKEHFYATCAELGIPHPHSQVFDCEAAQGAQDLEGYIRDFLDRVAEDSDLPFPAIVKGSDGSTWVNLRYEGKRKVFLVRSLEELAGVLRETVTAGYTDPLVVQRYIPGEDNQMRILTLYRNRSGVTTLSGYGEVLLEDHSPDLEGNARAVVSSVDETVARHGQALLDRLDWHGFAMFDIKVDAVNGKAYFLEMNPRLGQHHFYLTAAGQNPARYLLDDLVSPEPGLTPAVADLPALSTTMPLRAAMQHATPQQRARIQEARRHHRVIDPWKYRGDFRIAHRLYLTYRRLRPR